MATTVYDLFESVNKKIHINNSSDNIKLWKYLFEQCREVFIKPNPYNLIRSQKINVLLTMTTCKRLQLFTQTLNSIINTWLDLPIVNQFYVVDDNSSDEDRTQMCELYPWIDFKMKTIDERGHKESMIIIWNKLNEIKPTYWIHIEDDFLFFDKMNYVSTAINGLTLLQHFNIKQIAFSKNYAEKIDDYSIGGDIVYNDTYSLHDYQINKTGCKYWPHYTFRPSLCEVNAILSVGDYNLPSVFFEHEFATKYVQKGYRTAFFNKITHVHIGKLTSDLSGVNAYVLNKIPQFDYQNIVKVINLQRRPDRKERMMNELTKYGIDKYVDFVKAVDGKTLVNNCNIKKLFNGNDFHYRRSFIGCALSHYNIWIDLMNNNTADYYIIMEDDTVLAKNFDKHFKYISNNIPQHDIIFFGYLMLNSDYEQYKDTYYAESDDIAIRPLCKNLYIGGAHCYSITKQAASKLISYIANNGIKHGIDYLVGRVQDVVEVYEAFPQVAYAMWPDLPNKVVDSDIQYDFEPISSVSDKYVFLQGLDQIDYDCFHDKDLPLIDYELMADSIEGCVAFNTLGYFKNKIDTLIKSNFFKPTDGIYIKRDYYENVLKKKELL
jgi:GR25 family glycosyltransferase involved in LPS biosynthesis